MDIGKVMSVRPEDETLATLHCKPTSASVNVGRKGTIVARIEIVFIVINWKDDETRMIITRMTDNISTPACSALYVLQCLANATTTPKVPT